VIDLGNEAGLTRQFHIADLFEMVAEAVPDRIAIQSNDSILTYAELDLRTDALARGLAARGIGRGDHVGLYMRNRSEYLESYLAAIKVGAVPFNVNYRYKRQELAYLFDNADACCIIHDGEYAAEMDALRGALPKLRLTVCADGVSGRSDDYAALLLPGPKASFERSEDDYMLLYTGGTTGMPKGVMWPHKAFFFGCAGGGGYFHPAGAVEKPDDIRTRASEGPALKIFTIAPLMHGAAVWSAWAALLAGLTVVIDNAVRFDPVDIWDRVERDGVNLLQVVGDAMAIPLRDALRADPGRWQLAGVYNFGSGGALFSQHVQDDLAALLPNASITNGMGASETGASLSTKAQIEGMLRLRSDDTQKVLVGERFALPGETGFIARSGHLPLGYYKDPARSAETFRRIKGRSWVVTGDSGRLDDDGMITFFGRDSNCINSGGEKVFPEEVEKELRAHPAVFDALVVGMRDERWGEKVAAVVALRDGPRRPDTTDIAGFLKGRMAGYKIPKQFAFADEIQRSAAGKPDYAWAKQQLEAM
jgi:fatty-acyl-CoA synthase